MQQYYKTFFLFSRHSGVASGDPAPWAKYIFAAPLTKIAEYEAKNRRKCAKKCQSRTFAVVTSVIFERINPE